MTTRTTTAGRRSQRQQAGWSLRERHVGDRLADEASETNGVPLDGLEGCHAHASAFLTPTTNILQSPRYQRGWNFAETGRMTENSRGVSTSRST